MEFRWKKKEGEGNKTNKINCDNNFLLDVSVKNASNFLFNKVKYMEHNRSILCFPPPHHNSPALHFPLSSELLQNTSAASSSFYIIISAGQRGARKTGLCRNTGPIL
eukprot:98232-Hanusia_phi.AAC.1